MEYLKPSRMSASECLKVMLNNNKKKKKKTTFLEQPFCACVYQQYYSALE